LHEYSPQSTYRPVVLNITRHPPWSSRMCGCNDHQEV